MGQETEFKKLSNLAKNMGLITEREGETLYNLAKNGPGKGAIVEIGSFKGKSTIYLASGSKAAGREKVYAIDTHMAWKEKGKTRAGIYVPKKGAFKFFLSNLRKARVEDWVVPVKEYSHKANEKWSKPIRLLFIDGSHKYLHVKLDFLLWEPFIAKGGIIALHDSHEIESVKDFGRKCPWIRGPKKVVNERIIKSKRFKNIRIVDTITIATKIKKEGAFSRAENSLYAFWLKERLYMQRFRKLLVAVRNLLIKIKISLIIMYHLTISPNTNVGRLGIIIKKISPRLYYKLRKIKDEI